ncbi:aldo/keto reductase [Pseudomonas syringae pv. syringae]|uniref:aldo/keto reductase n=1 Tax=Pseudomonas syringae TaxID=317 RepID=UPI0023F98785|nr:aldo/keto reductase [Pseudomonas syringae]MDF5890241.1 aldo/keto reductase [Pseudomonas syringae pv. syringae]
MNNDTFEVPSVLLGKDGLKVGVQGFGTMAMGTGIYGPTDETEARATLERALERGVTLFDTADIYGDGAGESFLGSFVREHRNQVVLATKFGFVKTNDEQTPYRIDNSPESIHKAVDASLLRLGIDHIDLYYMHRRNREIPLADSIGAMAELVTAGKVRYLGLSEVTGDELRQADAIHSIAAIQSEWSLFSRDVEQSSVPVAAELGIGFVSFSPLGRGMLSGVVDTTKLDEDDARRYYPRFADGHAQSNAQLVQKIAQLAEERGITPSQVALSWLYARSQVHGLTVVPIPGTRKRSRLEENLGALDVQLTQIELANLDRLAESVQGIRGA